MYRPHYDAKINALYFLDEAVPETIPPQGGLNIFVCGGLQNPDKMVPLLGRSAPFAPAALKGYKRTSETVQGREIPFMVPDENDPGRVLTGVVWLDLTREERENIETFELAGGLRKREKVRITVGEATIDAMTYLKR